MRVFVSSCLSAACALAFASCTVPDLDANQWECQTGSDCAVGWACVTQSAGEMGKCVSVAEALSPQSDVSASVPDAGVEDLGEVASDASGSTAETATEPDAQPECQTVDCNGGDQCTKEDKCAGGECSGIAVSCDDNDECTADSCDPAVGCVNAPLPCGSCGELFECVDNCAEGDQACEDGCAAATTPEGIAAHDGVRECLDSAGCTKGGLTVGEAGICAATNCESVVSVCYPDGPLNCEDLVNCFGACDDEADCEATCAQQASVDSVNQVYAVNDCMKQSGCGAGSRAERAACAAAQCTAELSDCGF